MTSTPARETMHRPKNNRNAIARPPSTRFQPWLHRLLIMVGAMLAFAFVGSGIYSEYTWHTLKRTARFVTGPDLSITSLDEGAAQAGFELGDRLLRVGDIEVTSLLDYRQAVQQIPIGAITQVRIRRGSLVLEIPVLVQARQPDLQSLGYTLVALCFLCIGALVGMVKPRLRATRLFLLTCLSMGLYFATLRKGPVWLHYSNVVFLALSPGFAIHFFASFLQANRLSRTRWWPLFYLPSLVLMGATLFTLALSVRAGTGIWFNATYSLLTNACFVYLALSGIFGLVLVGRAYARTPPSGSRRELQWVLWGLGCACLAAVVDTALTLADLQSPETSVLTLVLVLPLPLGFAFSILRYRLLDVELVISRSLVYGALTAGLVAVYVLFVGRASSWLDRAAGGSSSGLVLFLAALIVGILVLPLRSRLQAIIDRRFFRHQVDFQRATIQWSQELSTSMRFSSLQDLLVNRIPQELMIERAWLLALSDDGQGLRPLALVPAETGRDTRYAHDDTGLEVPVASVEAAGLGQPSQVLLLSHDSDSAASLRDRAQEATGIQELWRRAGVQVALPLVSEGSLVGLYLLGRKLSNDIYQRQEVDLLRTLSNQAAIALSNARFYEQLQAASVELEDRVRERTQSLRDFISVVYHELGTPLTAIQGYTELLLERRAGELAEQQVRFLETVHRNGQRLQRLVDDLSDISKIDDERLTLSLQAVDVGSAVEEALQALAATIEEKKLRVELAPGLSEIMVSADPGRLVQILTNLLSNACRFTPEGGQVAIACAADGGTAEITVRDNGIGMHSDDLERLFSRFFRSDDPRVRAQPGWGLGLAISRSLIELHGGRIWVQSEPGTGTAFTFSLRSSGAAGAHRDAQAPGTVAAPPTGRAMPPPLS